MKIVASFPITFYNQKLSQTKHNSKHPVQMLLSLFEARPHKLFLTVLTVETMETPSKQHQTDKVQVARSKMTRKSP